MSAQETQVLKLDAQAGRQLSDRLQRAGYMFKNAPHAWFQARGENVSVTHYKSGKLVVQGKALALWCERFLGQGAVSVSKPGPEKIRGAHLGSDEAGKGDSFGPLVVCGVAVPEEQLAVLKSMGVGDSKAIADGRIRLLADQIRKHCPYREIFLEPEEYNHEWKAAGDNLNTLLVKLHVDVLTKLERETGIQQAVVDRFAAKEPVRQKLGLLNSAWKVLEVPRAESYMAVGAASILARDRFLEAMERASETWAVDFPLGSGAPVAPAVRRFLEIHGPDSLPKVCKMHFRNIQKIVEKGLWS
ncbi:MAG: ribonuclease HIII [Planctomycetota bacterium]|nr:MAG: ribonuclease HIII [Planctomycetota bacterium]